MAAANPLPRPAFVNFATPAPGHIVKQYDKLYDKIKHNENNTK